MTDWPETHNQGWCSIENLDVIKQMNTQDCDFGVQIAHDGRVWVCINGVAFLRFKPDRSHRQSISEEMPVVESQEYREGIRVNIEDFG